jgi:hypothetical protein
VDDTDKKARLHLARLCREIMLGAQFNSRTGYAALRMNHGDETYKDVAIDNWMAVSPIYTRRMQRALGYDKSHNVEAIFKGLQLDCGLSHQYFDAHFELDSEEEGRFWLRSCGALLEVEPRGEDAVRVMCHDIEDPTFDATAVATNPRARMRPIHRPPRVSSDQQPHCEWRVFIDEQAEPLLEPDGARYMADTRLAQLELALPQQDSGSGLPDYRGPLFEQLSLEGFSQAALVKICAELSIQYHLLVNALHWVIAERFGEEAALAVGEFQMAGSAWVVSERLLALLPEETKGIDAVVAVLEMHPALNPQAYFNTKVTRLDDTRALLEFGESEAQQESKQLGWYHLLDKGLVGGLESLVRGIDVRAQLRAVADSTKGATLAWEIVLEEGVAVADEPLAVQIAKGAVLYQTKLEDNIPILQL